MKSEMCCRPGHRMVFGGRPCPLQSCALGIVQYKVVNREGGVPLGSITLVCGAGGERRQGCLQGKDKDV
ncbi:hypothetical protein E2C01_011691 [Portunus trituberculatus]|uniref:Uncharacterized protein n=1 Tax=Portunus trituberculatus TaxID=210409 RepID=A0A5B7DC58_PORTR|nr:hypothetical protein [Portunus trituberculatus]